MLTSQMASRKSHHQPETQGLVEESHAGRGTCVGHDSRPRGCVSRLVWYLVHWLDTLRRDDPGGHRAAEEGTLVEPWPALQNYAVAQSIVRETNRRRVVWML